MSRDALLSACFAGDADTAVRFLADDPSLATARCEGIDSPALIIAAHRGHLRIVEALLEAGAPVDDREGASGTTALHWAAEGGHPQVAERLRSPPQHPEKSRVRLDESASLVDEVNSVLRDLHGRRHMRVQGLVLHAIDPLEVGVHLDVGVERRTVLALRLQLGDQPPHDAPFVPLEKRRQH